MISEKHIERINKVIKDMVFEFEGEIFTPDLSVKFEYQFAITGQRKMISVGEYYDYALLNVVITGLNDKFSQLLFTPEDNEQGKMIAKSFENRLYKFYSDLNLAMNFYKKNYLIF